MGVIGLVLTMLVDVHVDGCEKMLHASCAILDGFHVERCVLVDIVAWQFDRIVGKQLNVRLSWHPLAMSPRSHVGSLRDVYIDAILLIETWQGKHRRCD